jgi:predicted transcriptional regulator
LVGELKRVYNVLASLGGGEILEEPVAEKTGGVKKLKTLKTHLRTAHGVMPKDYYARFTLDPKKFPLVC